MKKRDTTSRGNFVPFSNAASRQPKELLSLLERTLLHYRLQGKVKKYQAFPEWETIVGKEIAAVCYPEKIIRNNVLVLRVVDSTWAQELCLFKQKILDSIFQYGKGAHIDDLHFTVSNPKDFPKKP